MSLTDLYRRLFRKATLKHSSNNKNNSRFRPRFDHLEDRTVPDGRPYPLPVIYAGAGGGEPVVKAFDALTGQLNYQRTVYDPGFTGGVRVAAADINRDGYPDVVAAPGPGGGPNVRVLDGHTGDQISGPLGSFFAFDPSFTGGVNVAAADVDGDLVPDVVCAAGPGGGPHVAVFSGRTGQEIASFFALEPEFDGGISVAAADLNWDGKADIAVGAGAGGAPRVVVYDVQTGTLIAGPLGSFYAFDGGFRGGVYLGADALTGDVNGDGARDLAVGSGPGMTAEAKVYDGRTGGVLRDLTPFGPADTGVRIGLAYVDDDKYADIVAGSGPGMTATVLVFSGQTGGTQLPAPQGEYQPFGASTGGVFVSSSNDPVEPGVSTPTSDPGSPYSGFSFTVHGEVYSTENPVVNTPTGTLTFKAMDYATYQTTTLGTVDLSPTGAAGTAAADLSVPGGLPAGSYALWFEYSGDAVFAGRMSVLGGMFVVAPPTVSATFDTTLIPVNADDDNGSAWKDDPDPYLPYIPVTRDFNATNLPKDDPELIKMTVAIGGGLAGTLSIDSYRRGGGSVSFWMDKRKAAAFSGVLPIAAGTDPTTVTLYVEGTHESYGPSDIEVLVAFTPQGTNQYVSQSYAMTVTPVINSFTATIPSPSINFSALDGTGLLGLFAGQRAPDVPGITFEAQLTNGPLTIKYMQNIVSDQNGPNEGGAALVYVAGSGLANKNRLPIVGSGLTFPCLDTLEDTGDPTNVPLTTTANPPDGVTVKTWDYPSVDPRDAGNADKLDVIDIKLSLRTYLIVRYADDSIYPIAYWDWYANFYANENMPGSGVSFIMDENGVNTAGGWVRSNDDPYKTAGPIYNGNMEWR